VQSTASTTVSDLIRNRLPALRGASRMLASYVAAHPEAVAFMAAKGLGEATGSSDAAVIRFAQALGYAGFLELRAALRRELLEKTGATPFAEGTLRGAGGDPVSEAFALDAALVQRTAGMNEAAVYDRIADRLVACRHVWVVAHGTSAPLAAYLATGLNRALPHAKPLTIGQADLSEELRELGPQDAMFGIGYVRYLPHTVNLLALARRRRAAVFAITDSLASPLAALADETLLAARDGTSFSPSQIGTVAIAHVLVAAVARRSTRVLGERLRAADRIWEDLGLWSATRTAESEAIPRTRRSRQKKDTT
jgi:DNA-binding MurR/RpiR family transcriptional regulator